MRIDAGSLAELPVNGVRVVKAGPREIGVVRASGRLFAIRNICPHQSGPLCSGLVMAPVNAKLVGAGIAADHRNPVITCPWHGWEFDLATGRCLTDPSMRVATYSAVVEDGRVWIEG